MRTTNQPGLKNFCGTIVKTVSVKNIAHFLETVIF